MKKKHIATIALLFALVSGVAMATKFLPPQKETICSEDSSHCVTIDPNAGVHQIRQAKKTESLWSFKNKVRWGKWAIANNGSKVVWVSWKYVKEDNLHEPAVIVFSRSGEQKTYPHDRFGKARKYKKTEHGPVGDFWRIWRESVRFVEGSVVIETPQGNKVKVAY